jgi:hypothetical protein
VTSNEEVVTIQEELAKCCKTFYTHLYTKGRIWSNVEEVQNLFIKNVENNIFRHVKSMFIQPMMKGELFIALEGFVKRKVPCMDKVVL